MWVPDEEGGYDIGEITTKEGDMAEVTILDTGFQQKKLRNVVDSNNKNEKRKKTKRYWKSKYFGEKS
jgi:hypothetical protein